jgi:negative regulator of sigma E activity
MRITLLLLLSTLALAAGDPSLQMPSADDVVARMLERDQKRQAGLTGYTAGRRYVLENRRHHKRAEMVVRMKCLNDGSKQFEIISSDGSGGIRNHVFPKLLSAEAEASQPGLRERSRIIPSNYSFKMVGTDSLNGRPAYVIAIAPKTPNKYLMDGRVWVDANEYAIVRIDGRPAKNPSFWVKSVHFIHTYVKQGPFWFPSTDESETEVRIFGETELRIEYFGYLPDARVVASSAESSQWSRP